MEDDEEFKPPTPGKLFKDHHGALYIAMTAKSFCRVRDYTGYPVFAARRMEWTMMEKAWLRDLQELDL